MLARVVDRSYCDSTIGLALRKDNDLYRLNSVITFDTLGSCVDYQNIGQILYSDGKKFQVIMTMTSMILVVTCGPGMVLYKSEQLCLCLCLCLYLCLCLCLCLFALMKKSEAVSDDKWQNLENMNYLIT